MRPLTAARIAAKLGNAVTGLPGNLFGIPTVLSANSPRQITLIDAAHILYSDDGGFDISTSESAAIEMDSVATDPPVATVMMSLFQRNLFGMQSHPVALVPPRADRRGPIW